MSENIKQALTEMLETLPDDCTWDDVMYQITVRQKIADGLAAARDPDLGVEALDQLHEFRGCPRMQAALVDDFDGPAQLAQEAFRALSRSWPRNSLATVM